MKNTIITLTLSILSIVTFSGTAKAQDFAKDCLPDCDSAAKVVIFNGESFDGTVYLHDTDVVLSKRQTQAVKEIATQGLQPVICQSEGLVIVTANN